MPSNSKKTETRRRLRKSNQGKKRKKAESKMSTPAFAVHAEKNE